MHPTYYYSKFLRWKFLKDHSAKSFRSSIVEADCNGLKIQIPRKSCQRISTRLSRKSLQEIVLVSFIRIPSQTYNPGDMLRINWKALNVLTSGAARATPGARNQDLLEGTASLSVVESDLSCVLFVTCLCLGGTVQSIRPGSAKKMKELRTKVGSKRTREIQGGESWQNRVVGACLQ